MSRRECQRSQSVGPACTVGEQGSRLRTPGDFGLVTLRQLEVFLAVAKHEHVGRAAEELHLSPSAASSALSSLEGSVGRRLFDRSGRGLRLNSDGRRFRGPATDTLRRAGELASVLGDGRGGRMVVGASSTIANHVLAAALARFADDVPDAELRLDIGNTQYVRDRLLDHALDLAYVEGPVPHPALEATAWRSDHLVMFTSPTDPRAGGGPLTVDDLGRQRWVLREEGSGTRETLLRALGDAASRVSRVLSMGSSEAVAQAVEEGGGIGCLSRMVVQREFALGRLVELDVPKQWDLRRTLWRLTRRGDTGGRLVEAFEAHLAAGQTAGE